MSTSGARRFLTRKKQAERYGKSTKTIERWGDDPDMNMPKEYWIGSTPHRAEDELEAWERSRVGDAPPRGREGSTGAAAE